MHETIGLWTLHAARGISWQHTCRALICHTSYNIVNDTSITKHNFSSIHSSFQKPFALKRKPFSNSIYVLKGIRFSSNHSNIASLLGFAFHIPRNGCQLFYINQKKCTAVILKSWFSASFGHSFKLILNAIKCFFWHV